jgi:peptide/nickel transport system substrate-binding protein
MLNRKQFLRRAAALTGTAVLLSPSLAAAQDRARSTLKFVPQMALTILDPVVTTAAVTVAHGYLVWDTLYGVNNKLEPKPQMAESATVSADGKTWTIKLRDGLVFHDGQPVRSRDCIASLERWSKRDVSGLALAKVVEGYQVVDERSFTIKLRKPYPRMLHTLGKPHSSPAFMMPERLAQTSPTQAIGELVGSGPYRFVSKEFVPGSKVVYEKFDRYKPRSEAAEWTSGAKLAHFDRVEWHIISDPATAAAALQNGEVDWVETPLIDLLPVLQSNPNVRVEVGDPYGIVGIMRFNSAQAPFNNPKVRRAIFEATNQNDYMGALGLGKSDYEVCMSGYPCGMPGVKNGIAGKPGGLELARKLLKESGYKGEKVVLLNPTDSPMASPFGPVTADLLKRVGFNVDMQDMDWGTVTQRRTSREPVDKGGWSIFHTTWPSVSIGDPLLNSNVRGQGQAGWFGWFDDAETEKLADAWLDATDAAAQQKLFEDSQRRAMEMMPSVLLGKFTVKTAMRKNITGMVQGSAPFFWGVRRA